MMLEVAHIVPWEHYKKQGQVAFWEYFTVYINSPGIM